MAYKVAVYSNLLRMIMDVVKNRKSVKNVLMTGKKKGVAEQQPAKDPELLNLKTCIDENGKIRYYQASL